MNTTDKPYSDPAYRAAVEVMADRGSLGDLLDAAHDRSKLGLAASVHAGAYRREVIEEIAAKLETLPSEKNRSGDWFARWIRQEYADA